MRILLFLICQLLVVKGFDVLCDSSETNYKNVTIVRNQINRFRRNPPDNPLDTIIERMQALSRVTNAITLQQGLLDGTVPPYDVIAELLHFESVKSSEFLDPAADKMKSVLDSILNLPQEMKTDQLVEGAEDFFDVMTRLKDQINGVTNVGEWVLKSSVEEDLKVLGTTGFDFTVIDDVKKFVRALEVHIAQIKKFSNTHKEENSKVTFEEIVSNAAELIKKSKELPDSIEKMVKLKSGNNATGSFSDMNKLSGAVTLFYKEKSKLSINDDGKSGLNENIDKFSKKKNGRRSLTHTNGFSKGFNELAALPSSLSDSWLKTKTDLKILSKALSPIHSFTGEIKKHFEAIESMKSKSSSAINSVQKLVKSVASGSISTNAAIITENIYKCFEPVLVTKQQAVTDLEPINTDMKAIDEERSRMKGILQKISRFFANPDVLGLIEDIKGIASKATSDDKAALKDVVDEMVGYKKTEELNKMIKDFEQLLKPVDNQPIQNLAKTVQGKFPTLDKFQKTMKAFEKMFLCLQGLDFKDVRALNQIIVNSRDLQKPIPEPLKTDMEKVVKIIDSLQDMKDFSGVVEGMKKQKTVQPEELNANTLNSKHSKTIGRATWGIVDMRDLIGQENQFDIVKKQFGMVESEISAVTGLSPEDFSNLKDLGKFEVMQSELEKWRSGVKLPVDESLENYKTIFLDAKTVAGIDDVKKISDSVEKLESLVSDPTKKQDLKDLQMTLNALDSIGLNLADYSNDFDGAPDALKQIDMFFAKRNKKIDQSIPSNPNQVGTNGSLAVLDDDTMFEEATTEKQFYKQDWFIGGCVCAVIGLIIAGLSTLACWHYEKCCFKSHHLEDDDDVEKQETYHPETQTETRTPVTTSQVNENELLKKEKALELPAKKKGTKKSKSIGGNAEKGTKKRPTTTKPKSTKLVVPKWAIRRDLYQIPANAFKSFINGLCRDIAVWQWTRAQHYENIYPENFLIYITEEILRRVILETFRPNNRHVARQQRNPTLKVGKNQIFIHPDLFARCERKDKWFFGCHFALPNSSKMYMTQLPFAPNNHCSRTDDKFFWMIGQIKVNAVVMICTEDELGYDSRDYFPEEPGEVKIISKTGPSKTPFTVKCISVEHLIPGLIIKRKLRISFHGPNVPKKDQAKPPGKDKQLGDEYLCEDFDPNNIDHEFDHYQWLGWPAGSVPEDIGAAIRMMEEIRGLQNVVVHCLYGVERCSSFVAMEFARQKVYTQVTNYRGSGNIDWIQLVAGIQNYRPGALESNIHVAFIMKVLVEMTRREYTQQLDEQVQKNYRLITEAYDYALNEHKKKWREEVEKKQRELQRKKQGGKAADLELEDTQKSEKSLQVEKTQSGIDLV
ncbi:unnamed protein product [Caenorhabditis brenneri]